MEKESKNSKILSVIALILAIICLGIGFTAYSSTFIIHSNAVVSPHRSIFRVAFTGDISCVTTGGAVINSKGFAIGTTLYGIDVTFTEPGQSATCTATIENTGGYIAYLNSITMGKVTCKSTNRYTVGKENNLVKEACNGVSVSVTSNSVSVISTVEKEGTNTSIVGESIPAKRGLQNIKIKIDYREGASVANETFDIKVPQAVLTYGSVD